MSTAPGISDVDVLQHLVWLANGAMEPEAARAILKIKFDAAAKKRIRQLLRKNNRGTISAQERVVLERFLRVGKLVDLFQAKALLALKQAEQPG